MRISDWSSDVCSSDLVREGRPRHAGADRTPLPRSARGGMILEAPTFDATLYVAERMREWDRREIFAARWNDDPFPLAAECQLYGSFTWVAHLDRPIAFVGATPMPPGVWSVLLFATDEFHKIRLSLTKHAKRVMIPALVEVRAHRAECHSLNRKSVG